MSSKTIWDNHGNRIGEDVASVDRNGLHCITHYDNHGNRIGRSYETRDFRGEIYMIHEDACGDRIARSVITTDWWGDYYLKTDIIHNKNKEKEEYQNGRDASSTDGFFSVMGYALLKILKFFCLIYVFEIMLAAGVTIWPFLCIPFINQSGMVSKLGPIMVSIAGVLMLAYIVYFVIVICKKWKKQIAWKTVFWYVFCWFVIGPLAYIVLLRKK